MIVGRAEGTAMLLRESVRPLLLLLVWDVIVVGLFQFAHRSWMDQPALPFALIGSVLVLFMSVRNNAAYARWFEARTLWGAVVNNSRSFARQMDSLAGGRPDLTRAAIGYAYALRASLGGGDAAADADPFLPGEWSARLQGRGNQAAAILHEIGRGVAASMNAQKDAQGNAQACCGASHAAIDRTLSDLANAQGGLERILRTPLAIGFALFPGLITRIYCTVLPLSMVQELGWITPLGSTLLGFLFVALDRIGADLERPCAASVHALPMRAIARTIEIDLLQAIGSAAPPPIQPVRGVLP